ncbi:MAG TPA: type III-B CRISPR module RAMP protein Cmr1 [Agitococcus sp.]|nr:type III-B CRISPR module RAMP protein Cmr1 [Agitococcus sp.]HNC03928.1 type III-B CRISPR module RAMP protein Cmr1 [Agitococcus sp.]
MLRKPPTSLDPDKALASTQAPTWTTLECELVTPMYGGGVATHTVDEKMPIRVSAIRGQLRFWWRLLATHLWRLGSVQAIRQAEADLWGGIDDKTKASKVFLKVSDIRSLNITPWAKYNTNPRTGQYKSLPDPENWANVPYVLFPAQGKRPGGADAEAPHSLAKAGLNFQLHLTFDNITDIQQKQVWEALRWWANFGGLGARTRRGLGAVKVSSLENQALIRPITIDEANKVGCQLITRQQVNSSYQAFTESVNRLQKFRQVDIGRPNHSSRSRWPEPDAIRRIKNQYLVDGAKTHRPIHQAGNLFPRAAFGLPIIFKFKDDNIRGNGNQPEPSQTSLQPIVGDSVKERMASPLILRPYFDGNRWRAAALLLPCGHINNLKLDLSGDKATYWNPAQAQNVPPIAQNGGIDALSAFMNFFAKKG